MTATTPVRTSARVSLRLAAALLAVALPAAAQEEAPPPDASSGTEAAAPARASERLGLSEGRHRFSLFVGQQLGGTAREAEIATAPITGGDPGNPSDPPGSDPFRAVIDLDAGSLWGLRYGYMFRKKWGLELSWSQGSSDLSDGETFDAEDATTVAVLESAISDPAERAAMVSRLEARNGPFDIDTSYLDLGFVFVANPKGRWVAEVDAGLGWSWGDLDDDPALLERLVHSNVEEGTGDPYVIANTLPSEDPTGGEACPADNDPCVAMQDGNGLTWHVGGGVSYAFTDAVHLRMGVRFRWVEQVVDPGDSFLQTEGTLGLSFLVGGR
jgi:opacity protein-like surface antigen